MLNNFSLIIIDESTDARITEALRKEGYEIYSIQEMIPGIDDIDIIELAVRNEGYIITEDKDFGDEIVFRKAPHNGAMLLRLSGVDIEEKIRRVLITLEKYSEELTEAFAVLSKNKLRIRK